MSKILDLTESVIGRLRVIRLDIEKTAIKKGKPYWICQCQCGNMKTISTGDLRSGKTLSCGCYMRQRIKESLTTHGLKGTRIYGIWLGIKKRCYNKSRPDYKYYGGRGIKMHGPWINDCGLFAKETSDGYSPELQIDRTNNDGDYEPGNVRWVNKSEQMKNRRNSVFIERDGKRMCAADWCRFLGLKKGRITARMHQMKESGEIALAYFIENEKNKIRTA